MVKKKSIVTLNYFYYILGVDRHLFSLNIAAEKRGLKSKFLHDACNDPFILLTSHIPHNQTIKAISNKDIFVAGGGLAAAVSNGYSISYFPSNDDVLFLHISSLKNCVTINSETLLNEIIKALGDIKELFE